MSIYQCRNGKILKHADPSIGCIDSESIENSGSDQKKWLLKKSEKGGLLPMHKLEIMWF